jgi:hypothetical protein
LLTWVLDTRAVLLSRKKKIRPTSPLCFLVSLSPKRDVGSSLLFFKIQYRDTVFKGQVHCWVNDVTFVDVVDDREKM